MQVRTNRQQTNVTGFILPNTIVDIWVSPGAQAESGSTGQNEQHRREQHKLLWCLLDLQHQDLQHLKAMLSVCLTKCLFSPRRGAIAEIAVAPASTAPPPMIPKLLTARTRCIMRWMKYWLIREPFSPKRAVLFLRGFLLSGIWGYLPSLNRKSFCQKALTEFAK